jgi:phage shock protein C
LHKIEVLRLISIESSYSVCRYKLRYILRKLTFYFHRINKFPSYQTCHIKHLSLFDLIPMNLETFNGSPIFYIIGTGLLFIFGPVVSAIAVRISLPMFWQWCVMALCIIYGISPLLFVVGSSNLAKYLGCTIENLYYICPGNQWIGNLMSWSNLAPWITILTLPSGIFGLTGILFSISMRSMGKTTPFLYRRRHRKFCAGVCVAIAERLGLSLLGVRVAIVLSMILFPEIALVLYCWMWIAFPLDSSLDIRQKE